MLPVKRTWVTFTNNNKRPLIKKYYINITFYFPYKWYYSFWNTKWNRRKQRRAFEFSSIQEIMSSYEFNYWKFYRVLHRIFPNTCTIPILLKYLTRFYHRSVFPACYAIDFQVMNCSIMEERIQLAFPRSVPKTASSCGFKEHVDAFWRAYMLPRKSLYEG